MHKCLPRDAIHSAVFAVVRCPSVRLFVTLMYRNGQTYNQTFSSPGGPIILVFQKGTRLRNSDGSPSTGAPNRGGVPKICDFLPVFQKYRYRYRTDMKKIPTKIPNTDTDSKYRYRPSSTSEMGVSVIRIDK